MPPELRALTLAEKLQLVEDVWARIVEDSADALAVSTEPRKELRRRLPAQQAAPETAVPRERMGEALLKRQAGH